MAIAFARQGEDNHVEQQTTTNGSIITSTVYVAGGLEEITSTGASTTLTKYLGASGLPTAERVGTNGPLSYLATDGQGTISETLDGSGNVTSAQLYTPYGNVRYSSGSSPTSLGYTGQRADSAMGLDYYHARYYDPIAGQFISADTVQGGLNRYGYIAGNPTTATDPSGHRLCLGESEISCVGVPPSSGSGTGHPPTIVETDKNTDKKEVRNDDGTLTLTTITTIKYTWSNGRVTTDSWSSSQTICDRECHALHARNTALDSMRQEALIYAVSGVIGEVIGGLAELAALNDPIQWLGTAAAIITAGENVLSWLATLIPTFAAQAYGIMHALSQALAVINGVLAVVGALAFIEALATPAIVAAKGLPALLISLAIGIVGEVMQTVAQVALAKAAELAAEVTRQSAMNIKDWCAGPGAGKCVG